MDLLPIFFVLGMVLLAVGLSWRPSAPQPWHGFLAPAGAWVMAVCGIIYLVVGARGGVH